VRELERRELAVRTVPASRAWGALPAKAWLTAGAAVTAGTLAGLAAMPVLLWTSPLIGTLVLMGARRRSTRDRDVARGAGDGGVPRGGRSRRPR
jgi:hypothetical protein